HRHRVAGLLSHLLRCTPQDNRVFFVRHDYGGAADFRRTWGYSYEDHIPDGWRFIVADPTLDLEREMRTCHLTTQRHPSPAGDEWHHSRQGEDAFARLPHELLGLIFFKLPSADVCNLRLASRVVSSITTPELLPQSFWKSRFSSDYEMQFFFAKNPIP